jgi:hypothetical protein
VIGGTLDAKRTAIENVRVDHRRRDIRMPEQLLDRSNVVARFQQAAPAIRKLACDRSALLVINTHNEQLVGMALIVDAERRYRPTLHRGAGPELRDGPSKSQAASRSMHWAISASSFLAAVGLRLFR